MSSHTKPLICPVCKKEPALIRRCSNPLTDYTVFQVECGCPRTSGVWLTPRAAVMDWNDHANENADCVVDSDDQKFA